MTFYAKFVDTLVKNVATISAIVVAVIQFTIRAYNENDGSAKVRKFINKVLFIVNRFTSFVYESVNTDVETVPAIQEVKSIKSNKRRAA